MESAIRLFSSSSAQNRGRRSIPGTYSSALASSALIWAVTARGDPAESARWGRSRNSDRQKHQPHVATVRGGGTIQEH